jgi:hypothetical protein
MDLFLKTLGVIFLAILLVIGLVVAYVAWRIWRFFRQLRRMAGSLEQFAAGLVPTARITLQPVAHPDWTDRDRIEEFAGPLRTAGFVDVGMYDVAPTMSRLLVLLHPDHRLYAVVRQQPTHGVALDLLAPLADESVWVYSTDPQRTLLDPPGFVTARAFSQLDAANLLARLLADLPAHPREPVSRAAFPNFFEALWAREFAWRVERGGLTDEEIDRMSSGGDEILDRSEMLRLQWDGAVREYYQDQLQDSLLATGCFTAQEWEKIRERVRFVHDKLSWEDVLALCDLSPAFAAEGADDDSEAERIAREAERIAAAFPPKIAFPRINDLLLPASRFQKITTVDGPLAADVYLAPEVDISAGYYDSDDD